MGRRLWLSLGFASGLLSGCTSAIEVLGAGPAAQSAPGAPPVYLAMTDRDVELANEALDRALETRLSGSSTEWRNLRSGNSGVITPLATFRAEDGTYCRRYREELRIAGRRASYVDTACRERSGYWAPLAG